MTDILLQYILPPILGAIGWLATHVASRNKRRTDAIGDLNGTIEQLVDKYTDTLNMLVEVRKENANLLVGQAQMQEEIRTLRLENAGLRAEIEQLNDRIAGIKTITRGKA